jgi:hypothetical protein
MLKYADSPEYLVLLAQQILSTEKVEEIIKLSDDWFVHKYHIINLKMNFIFKKKTPIAQYISITALGPKHT